MPAPATGQLLDADRRTRRTFGGTWTDAPATAALVGLPTSAELRTLGLVDALAVRREHRTCIVRRDGVGSPRRRGGGRSVFPRL